MRRLKSSVQLNYSSQKKRIDYSLLIVVLILTFFGLIMVYDASIVQSLRDYNDKYFYIKQQLIWVFLGLASLIFFSFFDYHHLKKLSLIFFPISFLLLMAVLAPGLGVIGGGAHRWLKLGSLTIQPAEIIKLTSIIFFANLFEKNNSSKIFLITLVLITLILVVFQKDMGSAIVFFLTSVATFFLAGAPMRYFLASLPVALVGFVILVLTSSYRRHRILAFFDPFSDPRGYSYHISQVLIALGTGNWFGLGLGESRQKFEYIPEVTTDSIFAIVGEEFGFLGSLFLILMLSFLVYRGFVISNNVSDNFGRFLGFGLTLWLGIQAAINLAAMVALVPLTGVPLPFISYGGSALLANLTAVGILLNISKSSNI